MAIYYHPYLRKIQTDRRNSDEKSFSRITNTSINKSSLLPVIINSNPNVSKSHQFSKKKHLSPISNYVLTTPRDEKKSNTKSTIICNPAIPFEKRLKKNYSHIQNHKNPKKVNLPKISFSKERKSINLSIDGNKENKFFHKIQKSIFYQSQPGKDQYGKIKTNQDSYLVIQNIFDNKNYDIIGIFDGHGTNGQQVSKKISKETNYYFTCISNFSNTMSLPIYHKLVRHDYLFVKNFVEFLQEKLIYSDFDIHFSGSTCILLFIIANHIVISNTGDSRGIIVSNMANERTNTSVFPLSTDHKPNLPTESDRIIRSNGEIRKDKEGGPDRVWQKGEDYPGIAMSRSLGDLVAKNLGVCFEPEVSEREINNNDMYIVLASDGLWDMLSNEEVMEIVNKYYWNNNPEEAVKELIEEASRRYEDENIARDDITVIIYFFNKEESNYMRM